jgi:hypothetical protein
MDMRVVFAVWFIIRKMLKTALSTIGFWIDKG